MTEFLENIGLFWGSTTGNQEDAAKFLIDYMTSEGFKIDSHDIRSTNPNEMFIGSEVYINGIARVLKKIVELDINNIRLSNINSFYLLKALPSKSVDSIYLINPDPWEKKKHH